MIDPYIQFFKGKRVTLQGLGLLGRSIGDARFIAEYGGFVTVTDTKTAEQLHTSTEKLAGIENIVFHLGGHQETDFTNVDMIIKSAGVRLDSPYIALAEKSNIPIYMSTALAAWWAHEAGVCIVGVTGTRGKTTVTQAVVHILRALGFVAHVGGNVRGVSTLELLPHMHAGDVLVLELDSWQLQGFRSLGISPDVAIFTNFMPDHQNYYPNMESYFYDKAGIFVHQREGDTLIVGEPVLDKVLKNNPPVKPISPMQIPESWRLSVLGAHNRENIRLAVGAVRAVQSRFPNISVGEDRLKQAVESFESVEGRLQFVREVRGVKIYNDNNATTPEATMVALTALYNSDKKNIILIAGGSDKGLPFTNLIHVVEKSCKSVLLLEGSGTEKLRLLLPGARVQQTLQGAVFGALQLAEPGDIIVFSPACASFGMFQNEYDRNDQFLKIVAAV